MVKSVMVKISSLRYDTDKREEEERMVEIYSKPRGSLSQKNEQEIALLRHYKIISYVSHVLHVECVSFDIYD